MKNYKSELINKILEERGHEMSALHYESECIETWINEAKGAYPKLCDYQSEWLNYIKEVNGGGGVGGEEPKPEPPIGAFPYETVTTNNTATVNHVVPFEYKSAILKGNSKKVVGKNKCNMEEIKTGWIDGSTGQILKDSGVHIPVEVTGTITISNYIHSDIRFVYEYDASGNYLGRTKVTTDTVTMVLRQNTTLIRIGFYKGTLSTVKSLELQVEQGENATEYEPYNSTLVSVEMPVLKTANSNNLIDTNPNSWHIIDGKTQIIQNKPIKVQPNTTYSFFINSSVWGYIFKCDEFGKTSKQYIGNNKGGGSFVTDDDCYYIIARNDLTADVTKAHTNKMRLFQGTKDLGYSGYVVEVKSIILTVNEDVTLRSNGDICDELNLLSGQLMQRIGEDGVVLSQEVVKTVDLTVVNQDGEPLSKIKPIEETMHITVSGTPINPTAVLEVPVEAITQNLNSFIGED